MFDLWVTGRVVDADGVPLAGVAVSVAEDGWSLALDTSRDVIVWRPEQTTVTGADGRFAFDERAFRDVDDDDWEEVDENGDPVEEEPDDDWRDDLWRVVLRQGAAFDARGDIDLLDGPADLGDVEFRPAPAREVRVVASSGAPVPGGTLTFNLFTGTQLKDRRALIWTLPLDGRGAASIPLLGISEERTLNWSVRAPGHIARAERYDGDWREPHDAPLVLVARPACRVRGRAVDPSGAPVPGLLVNVFSATPPTVTQIRAMDWHVTTASDGRFDVEFDRPEGATLYVHDGWALPGAPGEREVRLPYPAGTCRTSVPLDGCTDGGVMDVGDVVVSPREAGRDDVTPATLRVRIVDGRGDPIAGAHISVLDEVVCDGAMHAIEQADGEGRHVFRGLAPGTYRVSVQAPIDGVECHVDVRGLPPGAEEVEVPVSGGGTVRIDLVAAESPGATAVFHRVHVDVERSERGVGYESRGDSVTVRTHPGRATFTVRAHGRDPATLQDVDVLADRPTRVRAVLHPASDS